MNMLYIAYILKVYYKCNLRVLVVLKDSHVTYLIGILTMKNFIIFTLGGYSQTLAAGKHNVTVAHLVFNSTSVCLCSWGFFCLSVWTIFKYY